MLELLQRAGYVPRIAVWELTLACNMSCRHCGSHAGQSRDDELSTREALDLCGALARAGCRRITLSGGEPLLREDWPSLVRELAGLGVEVNMISNGLALTREVVSTALDEGMNGMAFSIDGLEESHTHLRHRKDSWRKIIANFEMCRDMGLPTGAITTVYRRNAGELEAMREMLAGLGVSNWQLQLATPSGHMSLNRDLLIDPAHVLDIVPRTAALRQLPGKPKIDVGDNIGYFGGHEEALRGDPDRDLALPFWCGCNAGCGVVGIESNGNIKGCLSLPSAKNGVDVFVEGNLRKRSFDEIWCDPDAFAFNRKFTVESLRGFCRTCEYAEVCRGGCTWAAFAHTGSRYEALYCHHRQLQEKLARDPAGASGEEAAASD